MRLKKLISLCAISTLVGLLPFAAAAEQKLFVYTSMKESMIGDLKIAFAKKHADIKLDFQ